MKSLFTILKSFGTISCQVVTLGLVVTPGFYCDPWPGCDPGLGCDPWPGCDSRSGGDPWPGYNPSSGCDP